MKLSKFLILTVSLVLASSVSAKTLTIGIDTSESNPLVASEVSAKAAAEYVRAEVSKLELGDFVRVRTFGDRINVHPSQTIRITRGNRADKVAATVARYVASLPTQSLKGQSATNIVAFLEFGQFDCASGAHILLLTDGIESSAYTKGKALLAGKALPSPDADLLKGCGVTMFGFGQNTKGELPPTHVKAMRSSWTEWMRSAGAETFTVLIDP